MRNILKALRGAKIIARGQEGGCRITHYLLSDGRVVEIVERRK